MYLWKHNSSYTKTSKLDATKHKLSENEASPMSLITTMSFIFFKHLEQQG